MTDVLIGIFVIVLIAIMAVELRRKAGHYEFPFLAAVVFAGFIMVQVIGLRNDTGLPPGSLGKVVVMSILCVIACLVGFRSGAHRMPVLNWTYDQKKLLRAAWALVAIGAFFSILITRLPKEQTEVSQWTGRPVAYVFIAQCFPYGLAIALMLFLGSGRKAALFPIMVGVFLYLDLVLVGVRRTSAAAFFLLVLLAVWYTKRRCLPKLALFLCIVIGTLAMYSVSELRSLAHGDKQFASIFQGDLFSSDAGSKTINPLQNTRDVLQNGAAEVRNAAHLMASVEAGLNFDFGLNDWNALVFTLVPAQVFGKEFKNALMAPVNSTLASGGVGGYQADTGTTFCGIGDAFGSFWYFGFVKFLLIGWVLGTLNNGALKGNLAAAVLYMVLLTDGLVAITHASTLFLTYVAHAGIFLLPALWYAKRGNLALGSVPARTPSTRRSLLRARFPGAMRRHHFSRKRSC